MQPNRKDQQRAPKSLLSITA